MGSWADHATHPQGNRKGSTRKVAPGKLQNGGTTVEMPAIRDVLTKLRIVVAMARNILRHRALADEVKRAA